MYKTYKSKLTIILRPTKTALQKNNVKGTWNWIEFFVVGTNGGPNLAKHISLSDKDVYI